MTPASDIDVAVARIEARMEEREKMVEERAAALMREVSLASRAVEHRLEGLNAWRDMLNSERSKFVTRAELVAALVTTAALATVLLRTLRVF